MSIAPGDIRLTNIKNPGVAEDLEATLSGKTLEESMTGLVTPTDFTPLQFRGPRFDERRAKDLTSKGADIQSDLFSIDKGSYFFEIESGEERERYYIIQADEGLLVASERAGAGFITPEDSVAWAIDDEEFSDIEKVLRGEFEMSDRTHTLQAEEEIFQVPSWSAILEDGELPQDARETILGLGEGDQLYYEDEPNGVGLWSDGEHAFKGRQENGVTTVENFQELDFEIDLGKVDPHNPHLDILDLPKYADIDADLLTEKILDMATDPEEGIVQDWKRGDNVVAYKKDSSDPEMQVLGIGDYELEFTDQALSYLKEMLDSGNGIQDLLTRLGRMVEEPYQDDRFQGHEVGYWEIGGDPRLYTYTPEYGSTTFVALAGTHDDVSHLYSMNPSEIKDYLLKHELADTTIHELRDDMEAGHGYLRDVLYDSGHETRDVDLVLDYLDEHLPSIFDVEPDRGEYRKLVEEESDPEAYDRIDLVVNQSLEEVQEMADSELLYSLDPDSEYNEIHLDDSVSVNLRFQEGPSFDLEG